MHKRKRRTRKRTRWNKHRWQDLLAAYMKEHGCSSESDLIPLERKGCKSREQYEYAEAVRARLLVRKIREFPANDKTLAGRALMPLLTWANLFPRAIDWFVIEYRQAKRAR